MEVSLARLLAIALCVLAGALILVSNRRIRVRFQNDDPQLSQWIRFLYPALLTVTLFLLALLTIRLVDPSG